MYTQAQQVLWRGKCYECAPRGRRHGRPKGGKFRHLPQGTKRISQGSRSSRNARESLVPVIFLDAIGFYPQIFILLPGSLSRALLIFVDLALANREVPVLLSAVQLMSSEALDMRPRRRPSDGREWHSEESDCRRTPRKRVHPCEGDALYGRLQCRHLWPFTTTRIKPFRSFTTSNLPLGHIRSFPIRIFHIDQPDYAPET